MRYQHRAALATCLLALAACGESTSHRKGVGPWAHVAPAQIAEAKRYNVPAGFENDLGMQFVLIPAGTFLMGSPKCESGRLEDETQHEVTLTRPFYMSVHEVTNAEYRAMSPDHPDGWLRPSASRTLMLGDVDTGLPLGQPRQPVVHVDFDDAVAFAEWLSRRDSARVYRLPTEAEWERAARAGETGSRFTWGNSVEKAHLYANLIDQATVDALGYGSPGFPGDDGHRVAAPVGSYPPNGFGLHDMLGNVAEWCTDWLAPYPEDPVSDPVGPSAADAPAHSVLAHVGWMPTSEVRRVEMPARVVRGGSWAPYSYRARLALRACSARSTAATGFRLVSRLLERDGR